MARFLEIVGFRTERQGSGFTLATFLLVLDRFTLTPMWKRGCGTMAMVLQETILDGYVTETAEKSPIATQIPAQAGRIYSSIFGKSNQQERGYIQHILHFDNDCKGTHDTQSKRERTETSSNKNHMKAAETGAFSRKLSYFQTNPKLT